VISGQSLLVVATSVALIVALAWFFNRTLYGRALHATAVNRVGARLAGISPSFAGRSRSPSARWSARSAAC
jgi:branched-chain amino acid transport system permease protein